MFHKRDLYQLPRSVTHGPGWPSVHECDSVAASSVRGEPWLPLFPFVPISTLLLYARWPNSRAIPIRPGAFWHWPRSMMDSPGQRRPAVVASPCRACVTGCCASTPRVRRSEEHTSELQSHSDLVCRLLLEKKKK